MHAVIRSYSGPGASDLFDLLEKRTADVEELMQSIEGFVTYLLVRTGDGGTSVTVCEDKAGADESIRRAREWIDANASHIPGSPPRVSEGRVVLRSEASARQRVTDSPQFA